VCVNVGIWVLGLSVLSQDARSNVVDLADKLEHGVLREVLKSEFTLRDISWVSLAEDSVTVPWNNLASLEGGPEVVLDALVRDVISNLLFHRNKPVQDFLVGQAVERASKAVQASGKGQHGRAESGSNQVSGVGRDVPSLVVRVDNEVQPHQLDEVLVVTKAQLVGQVKTVILVLLDISNLAIFEDVSVDLRSNGGELGNDVHGVLEGVLPVVLLIQALSIGLCKGRLVLKGGDGKGELSHWVEVRGAAVNELLNEFGDSRPCSQFGRQVADLLLRWNLASQEQPEQTYIQLIR